MAIAARFRHSLVIQRRSAGSTDGRGNAADTFTPQPAIQGLIQPRSSSELRGIEPAGVARVDGRAYLPIGTAIAPADRITKGSELYEVVGPARDAGGRGRHLELDVLRVVA